MTSNQKSYEQQALSPSRTDRRQPKITVEYHHPSREEIQEYGDLLNDSNRAAATAVSAAIYKDPLPSRRQPPPPPVSTPRAKTLIYSTPSPASLPHHVRDSLRKPPPPPPPRTAGARVDKGPSNGPPGHSRNISISQSTSNEMAFPPRLPPRVNTADLYPTEPSTFLARQLSNPIAASPPPRPSRANSATLYDLFSTESSTVPARQLSNPIAPSPPPRPSRANTTTLNDVFPTASNAGTKARRSTTKSKKGILGFMSESFTTFKESSTTSKRPVISTPYDPVFLTHVGFNSSTGEFTGLSKEWQQLLRESGISRQEQEKNPKAVMEIVKFYQEGHEDVWDKMNAQDSAPEGSSNLLQNPYTAPPPPPPKTPLPPVSNVRWTSTSDPDPSDVGSDHNSPASVHDEDTNQYYIRPQRLSSIFEVDSKGSSPNSTTAAKLPALLTDVDVTPESGSNQGAVAIRPKLHVRIPADPIAHSPPDSASENVLRPPGSQEHLRRRVSDKSSPIKLDELQTAFEGSNMQETDVESAKGSTGLEAHNPFSPHEPDDYSSSDSSSEPINLEAGQGLRRGAAAGSPEKRLLTPAERRLLTPGEPPPDEAVTEDVDYALTVLDTNISPWTNPAEWISADEQHINRTWKEHQILRSSDFDGVINGHKLYPRFIVHLCVHLTRCKCLERHRSDFKGHLQQWKDWDYVTLLCNHRVIRDYLWEIFQTELDDCRHKRTRHWIRKLLSFDTIRLRAHVVVMVGDRNSCSQAMARRGIEAQSLLNLLQGCLDLPLDPSVRRRHVGAVINLSRASGLYPECMILKGVELIGGDAVAGGGYGDVWKGSLQGELLAVKVVKVYQKSDVVKLLKEFSCEAVIWRQLRHPNILPFYGVYHLTDNSTRVCLVSPWMENGNVVDFLKQAPETNCVPLIHDIAAGLQYLHGLKPCIIHGDLKGLNILITPAGRACLADFGLATARDSKPITMPSMSTNGMVGTMRWQAPELLNPDPNEGNGASSVASDVYAFACVGYEMFSGEVPMHDLRDFGVILAVTQGRRPQRPSHDLCRIRGLDDDIWDLIENCWAGRPSERPSTSQIKARLHSLPNFPLDPRPTDTFDVFLPWRILGSQPRHPFSDLTFSPEDANQI